MDTKEIRIECPCCGSRLAVDVRSGNLVSWSRAGEADATGRPVVREEDWDQAHGRVKSRLESAEDRFEAGLGRERSREQDLDERFRRAKEKLEEDRADS